MSSFILLSLILNNVLIQLLDLNEMKIDNIISVERNFGKASCEFFIMKKIERNFEEASCEFFIMKKIERRFL